MIDTTKILFFSIVYVCGVLLFTSCDVTEYNPSGLTDESVYTQPEGFESLVNASYTYARWWYGKEEGYAFSEAGTDIWVSGSGDENVPLSTYEDLNSEVDIINGGGVDDLTGMWKQLYTVINLVNSGISRVGESGLSEDLQTTREAELRFLRAFYYWHIVDQWGGVHFTTDPTQGVETTANRTSVDQFYQQIFTDLEFAVSNLPPTTNDYGRATQPVAQAFLARMHVARGNNQEAIDMAENVISNSDFELLDDYNALWEMDNLQNSEVVWAVNYANDMTLNDRQDELLYPNGHFRGANNLHLMIGAAYYTLGIELTPARGGYFNRWVPSRFLVDLYDLENSTRFHDSFQTVYYATEADAGPDGVAPELSPGDTLLWFTRDEVPEAEEEQTPYMVFDRSDMYGSDGVPVQRNHFPTLKKHRDPTRSNWQLNPSSRDAFVIRLAEMYLIAAEASLNMENPGQAAGYINTIRERAARPGHEQDMRVDASDVDRDFLLDEWAREFAGEQMRWTVLKRNDALVDRVQQYNPDAAPHIQDFHRVRPIPQAQIDAVENDDEFVQNDGYSGR